MAAAVVDLDINEGDTFIMSMELWEDEDKENHPLGKK